MSISRHRNHRTPREFSLQELGIKLHADKAHHLNYLSLYEKYLDPIKTSIKDVMEIGVKNGGSLLLWIRYLPNIERIVGVDCNPLVEIDPRFHDLMPIINNDSRIHLVQMDQSDPSISNYGKFNLIIDDGGHDPIKQKKSLELLWPCLSSKGIYVIEDLESSYYIKEYPEAYRNPNGIMVYLQNLVHSIHSSYGKINKEDGIVEYESFEKLDSLECIHFHPNIVFLIKG